MVFRLRQRGRVGIRMKHFKVLSALSYLAASQIAHAEKPMIVVELFTSQGCYSCPPADEILTKLAQYDDVIALGLHVDYWDYLGWKDNFAIAKFGERQASYNAQIINRSRRVTPQMIFNGTTEVAGGVGRSVSRIKEHVTASRKTKEAATIKIVQNGNTVSLVLSPVSGTLGAADVNLVRYSPEEVVRIDRGENSGKTITYSNIVKSLSRVAKWDGYSATRVKFDLPQSGEYAVIVQGARFGPVYVARKITQKGN